MIDEQLIRMGVSGEFTGFNGTMCCIFLTYNNHDRDGIYIGSALEKRGIAGRIALRKGAVNGHIQKSCLYNFIIKMVQVVWKSRKGNDRTLAQKCGRRAYWLPKGRDHVISKPCMKLTLRA
jgi:hypothetical protein